MNVAIIGSQDLSDCTCGGSTHWPPTEDEKVHIEECARVGAWLLMLKIVTRLASNDKELVILSGVDLGADRLAQDAAGVLSVPYKVVQAKRGRGPYWPRLSDALVGKADQLIGVFRAGKIPAGPGLSIEKARSKGIPVHIWHGGKWS